MRACLRCRILVHGFLRLRYDACKLDRLVAFCCKREARLDPPNCEWAEALRVQVRLIGAAARSGLGGGEDESERPAAGEWIGGAPRESTARDILAADPERINVGQSAVAWGWPGRPNPSPGVDTPGGRFQALRGWEGIG